MFVALIVLLLLAPILFKDQIAEAIKKEANKNIDAELDFSDLDLSLFKAFPKISIEISQPSLTGVDAFEGQNLMKADEIYLATDWKSIIKSSEGITVSEILLDRPVINIKVNEDGKANYDITKETANSSSDNDLFGNIEYYEIRDGQFSYIDKTSNSKAVLSDINHSGRGAFKNVVFDLDTETDIEEISVYNGAIPYMKNAKLNADLKLGIDLDQNVYTIKENLVKLNGLHFEIVGTTTILDEGFDFDLKLNAINNSVASILSLIPNAFSKDFENISSKGTGSIKGLINGKYLADKGTFPKVNFDINLDNGQVKYPALKYPIEDIDLKMGVTANEGAWNDLSVNIPTYNFNIDGDEMKGDLIVNNIFNNAHIKASNIGTIDLKKFSEAFPIPEYDIRSGIINSDFKIDARQSDIESSNYTNIDFDGSVKGENVDLIYDELAINLNNFDAELNPSKINSSFNNLTIGKSDFNGDIDVINPLNALGSDQLVTTKIKSISKLLDLDELYAWSSKEQTSSDTITSNYDTFKNYKLDGQFSIEDIRYENYDIKNLSTNISYDQNALAINNSAFKLDNSPSAMRGKFNNIIDFVFEEKTLTGELFFETDKLNTNKYMNESGSSEEIDGVVEVPKNFDLEIYPEIGEVIYDDYVLNKVSGKIDVEDGIAALTNGVAHMFEGKFNFEGAYDSSDLGNPLFNFKYDISNMNFGRFIEKNETFKILAPLAQYINGVFNSTLVIEGPLKKDMMPDLFKIDASGFMETIQGTIDGFKPLQNIGDQLGISSFKNVNIKDSKNWFEVKDGYVILKPHDYEFDGMNFNVGGRHSIDQNLDYTINAKIPREKLSKAQLGKTLEMGMSEIEKQAKSRGVDISLGDYVYLDIFLTGTILKPKVKIIPVGSGGKTLKQVVADEVNKQKEILMDTLQQEAEKRTEALKDTVTAVVKEKTDTLKAVAKSELEKKTDEAKDIVKEEIKNRIDSTVAGEVTDTLGSILEDKLGGLLKDSGKSEADSIKAKLDGWNPFKKKKKD